MAVGASRIEPTVIAADPLFPNPVGPSPSGGPTTLPDGTTTPPDLRATFSTVAAPAQLIGPHFGGPFGPGDEPTPPPDGGPDHEPPDHQPPDHEPPDHQPPDGDPEPPVVDSSLPGHTEDHNPLGGPPGWTGDHPTSDPDLPGQGPATQDGDGPGRSAEHNPHGGPPGRTRDQASNAHGAKNTAH
jgi:hypothetical protein